MDISEHYIQLRLKLKHVRDDQELYITMGELADYLCCTMRNMNLIMNKFQEHGWARWSPQRGRGKKSILVFCKPVAEVAAERFDQLLHANRMEEAYEMSSSLPPQLRERLLHSLQLQFGLRSFEGVAGRTDTLRIPQNTHFQTFDPTQTAMWGEGFIITEVFDRLVRYNAERQQCEPSLAIAWESDQEGREWTFYLNKGVQFHHGRVMEAADVKFTFDRIVTDPDNPCKTMFGSIQHVELIDNLTVRFVLHKPNFMLPDLLSSLCASIVPRDVQMEPLRPIGTGPYRITHHDATLLVMEVFPTYFRGRAYIDRVEFLQLPQADLTESLVKKRLFSDGELRSVEHEIQGGVFMTFNMQKEGPHHDLYFRQAVRLLLDSDQLVESMDNPYMEKVDRLNHVRAREQQNVIPSEEAVTGQTGSDKSGLVQAATLLERSAYQGQPLRVWVEEGEQMEADMAWFAKRCETVGLNITVVTGDPVHMVYHDELQPYEMIYTGEVFDEHVMRSLITMYTFGNTLFLLAMNDYWRAELAQACENIVMIQEPVLRMERLIQLEGRLVEEALILPVYAFKEVHAHDVSLRNYKISGYGLPDLRQLWIKRKTDAPNTETSYPVYIPLW
ncbi:ABC transporter substrate-binding protein [Paenibacillus polysaccharolyticus]|uniref:ABC transporter substrate-binding protein n=1 Tax=Paenibacillus polysaccharolyticus TaxID=582692 RepID=UPI00203CAF0D|nr:ABC transporter substrate-binding protein [Paenibacillus polysaccharolyticus]MCM3135408.1 ABC transporter substrate-binding protein [Paenibacillus polysaccharolyticus]